MAEKTTRVLLIRHAVNDWIGSGKLPGRTPGVHLNERGRLQAEALADRLANAPIKAVYSSPLDRAIETATPLAARLNLPVVLLPGVAETDAGDWTGQAFEDLRKLDLWRTVQINPSEFAFPGGESMFTAQYRAVTAVNQARAAHPGELIAVVAHSDPIRLIVAHYLGLPLDLFQRVMIDPASISEFAFTEGGIPRLVRSNDCAHLPPEPEEPEKDEGGRMKDEPEEAKAEG